jgi:metal-responsive CopG/Arc/MetJ family transcriptional regulator
MTSVIKYVMSRYKGYKRISITIPAWTLRKIDKLADEVALSRSEVIAELCKYCLNDPDIIDDIYPYEEE